MLNLVLDVLTLTSILFDIALQKNLKSLQLHRNGLKQWFSIMNHITSPKQG
jgi:hypothetical protein